MHALYRRFSPGIAAAFIALMLLPAACGDSGKEPPSPTATGQPEAVFPVILEHDTRIIASADGADIREEPVPYQPRTPSTVYEGLASPDGSLLATFHDGKLFIQEGDSEPGAIAEVPSTDEFASIRWSPDGSRLVFDVSFDGSSASLYVVSVDGSGLVDIGQGLEGDAYLEGWSVAGDRLGFSVFSPGGQTTGAGPTSQMYVANADGSNRAAIGEFTQPQGDAGWDAPAWSPDGSFIAAFSPKGGMRILRTSGGEPLDLGVSSTLKWSWSPDSRFLAFDDSFQNSGIKIADVTQAGEARQLTNGSWPRWSPDGERIAFKRGSELFTIRPDGSGLASLGDFGSNERGELTWSADSADVEFVRGVSAVEYVFSINLRTGQAVRGPQSLTAHGFPGPGGYIELSPDGTRVAFLNPGFSKEGEATPGWFVMDVRRRDVMQVSSDPRTGDVYWTDSGVRFAFLGGTNGAFVAESDGSSPRQVSDSEAYSTIAWSPDGTYLAVGLRDGIEVVEVDGPDDRTLVGGLDPGSDIVQDIEWSPDGSALLYEVSRSTADGLPIGETFVVGIEGAPPQRLVRSDRDLPFAGWSPDGRTAAFARTDEGGVDLRLIDADGGNDRLLTRFEGENRSLMLSAAGSGPGRGPAGWSPDATKIAAVLNGTDLYVVDVSSGDATFVATNASYCLMAFLGWSPNGETMYVIPQCAPGGL